MKVLRVLEGESAEGKRRIGKITHSYRVKLKVPHAERRSLGESADWTTGVVQVLHRNAPNCLFIILNPQEIPTRGVAPPESLQGSLRLATRIHGPVSRAAVPLVKISRLP